MTKKIFKSVLLTACAVLALCTVFMLAMLNQYAGTQVRQELSGEAALAARGIEESGEGYFDGLSPDNRITWVSADGTVLYDSAADAAALPNHGDREEIREALQSGTGYSERYSVTMSQKTVYYALRIFDGSVVRISKEQTTVWMTVLDHLGIVLAIAAAIVLLSVAIAVAVSRKIVRPINNIDPEHPVIDVKYQEISPLLQKIRRQNLLIDRQMTDLRRRQEELRAITENMSEGLILTDEKGAVLFNNSSALRLLGLKSESDWAADMAPERAEVFRTAVRKASAGSHCEMRMEADGKIYQLLANPVTVEGKISGAVVILLDVTEKEQRENMRREFTSNVSHELRTPLTSIYGIADMMVSGIVRSEDMRKFAGDIFSEAGRLIALVNDIIRLSQLDENAAPAEFAPVELYAAAKDTAARLSAIAAGKDVAISVGGEKLTVRGDRAVIGEMLYNLCDNAVKYNRPGGTVTVTVENRGGRAAVVVADTGIGIPKEHLSRIYERFYRVDKSHSKAIGGTGLGLSIVKHGALVHGAEITTESTVGKGTTITVLFPAKLTLPDGTGSCAPSEKEI